MATQEIKNINALLAAYREHPTDDTRNALMVACLPMVEKQLRSMCVQRSLYAHTVDDVLALAPIVILATLKRFDPAEGIFVNFLVTKARYAALEFFRSEFRPQEKQFSVHRYNHSEKEHAPALEFRDHAAPRRFDAVDARLDSALIWAKVHDTVGKRDAEMMRMRFCDGRTYEALGAHLNISKGWALMRMRAALEKLSRVPMLKELVAQG